MEVINSLCIQKTMDGYYVFSCRSNPIFEFCGIWWVFPCLVSKRSELTQTLYKDSYHFPTRNLEKQGTSFQSFFSWLNLLRIRLEWIISHCQIVKCLQAKYDYFFKLIDYLDLRASSSQFCHKQCAAKCEILDIQKP